MSDIEEALEHRVGPLPLAGWLLAVAGGIGIAWWVRRRGGSSADTTTAVTPDGTQYGDPNGVGQDGTDTGDTTDTGAPAPVTNEEWGHMAEIRMVAHGYDPLMVDNAIRDYLAGNTLTTAERALIDETLVVAGPPPIAPPPEVPGGTTPQPPAKTTLPAPIGDGPGSVPPPVNVSRYHWGTPVARGETALGPS